MGCCDCLGIAPGYFTHAIVVRSHGHKWRCYPQATMGPSLSIGISVQDKAIKVTRSASKGTHYHADIGVVPAAIALVVIKALRQSLISHSGCMVTLPNWWLSTTYHRLQLWGCIHIKSMLRAFLFIFEQLLILFGVIYTTSTLSTPVDITLL